jgi:hypothetical protein
VKEQRGIDYRGPVIIAVPRLATVITVFVIEDEGRRFEAQRAIGYRFPCMTHLNVAHLSIRYQAPFSSLEAF